MTISRLGSIDLRHLTTNQPFCAGVILLQQGQLIVRLTTDSLPSPKGVQTSAYRIRGLGGDQRQGETIWECALREAQEKLQVELQLLPSPSTYFHEIDTGEQYTVTSTDAIPPFLLERQSNLYPYTPLRPGLPTGPHTYYCLFLARTLQPITHPGTTEGLLYIRPEHWPTLLQQPTLEHVLQQGASIIEQPVLARQRQLWIPAWESVTLAASLLPQHADLLQ